MADVLHKDLTGAELHEAKAHKTSHQDAGADEISIEGLLGTPAALTTHSTSGVHTAAQKVTGRLNSGSNIGTRPRVNFVEGTDLDLTDSTPNDELVITIPQIPVGGIIMFGAAAAPTGFLLCDGTAVSRTTYADLFAIVGTTFGVGNGSTTFNLPDLRQRFPLGKAASGTGSTLGGTGGTIDYSHTHSVPRDGWGQNGGAAIGRLHTSDGTRDWTATGDNATGASAAFNPPFQVVNFIIKY